MKPSFFWLILLVCWPVVGASQEIVYENVHEYEHCRVDTHTMYGGPKGHTLRCPKGAPSASYPLILQFHNTGHSLSLSVKGPRQVNASPTIPFSLSVDTASPLYIEARWPHHVDAEPAGYWAEIRDPAFVLSLLEHMVNGHQAMVRLGNTTQYVFFDPDAVHDFRRRVYGEPEPRDGYQGFAVGEEYDNEPERTPEQRGPVRGGDTDARGPRKVIQ